MKLPLISTTLCAAGALTSPASLIFTGVIDGDLTGGNPKAIVLTATAAIPDLAVFGVGSANNGGGTGGEEFTFPMGPANSGDIFIVTTNAANVSFFETNFSTPFTVFTGFTAANNNGNDAIEVFENGLVIDTFGVIDVDGTGETWEYSDGFAVRIGGDAGAFNESNFSINDDALDGLDETQQAAAIGAAFGFTVVPEPSAAFLLSFAGLGLICRRRR